MFDRPTRGAAWGSPSVVVAAAIALAACDGDDGEDPTTAADAPTEVHVDAEADSPSPPDDGQLEEQPAWSAPPVTEIGAPLAIEPAVVEGEDVAVALAGVTVHTEGANLHVAVRYDPDGDPPVDETGGPMDPDTAWIEAEEEELPEDLLVVDVTLPDGTTLSSGDEFLDPVEPGEEPDGPLLTPHVGMGDPWSWDQELWLWPSPDDQDGALEVSLDWPEQGIEDATVEIEVEDLDEAAERVAIAWPDEDG